MNPLPLIDIQLDRGTASDQLPQWNDTTKRFEVSRDLGALGDGINSIQFDLAPTATPTEGLMYWNADDGTLNIGMPGSSVNLQVGQEMLIRCKNAGLADIQNGDVVYISGASGQKPEITLADADDNSAEKVIGIATELIPYTGGSPWGFVATYGYVRGINATGTPVGETWLDGDVLYLSQTLGKLTNIEPTKPAYNTRIGYVINNAVDGSIFVAIQAGVDLSGLRDVDITSIADNDLLQYNSGTGVWENTSTVDGITLAGLTTFTGGLIKNTTRYTTTQTILTSDNVVFCNTDGGAWTATLPAGVEGQTFRIINSSSTGNQLTLAPNGAEHLLGANSNLTLDDSDTLIITYNTDDGWY